jgi:hypothetical protein
MVRRDGCEFSAERTAPASHLIAWRRGRGQRDPLHALAKVMGDAERVGTAARMASNSKAIQRQEIRKRGNVCRPVEDRPARRRRRSTDSRMIDRDQSYAQSFGQLLARIAGKPRVAGAVAEQDRLAGFIAPDFVGHKTPVGQREHLHGRLGL